MSNLGLSVAFQKLGIDSVFAQVGDCFVLEEMLTRGAIIGGEDSGHLIFLQHHTTGDGLITALQVLASIKKAEDALGDKGRVLVRYSGTQNMCRVMVEGPTKKETETHCRQIADVVKKMLS